MSTLLIPVSAHKCTSELHLAPSDGCQKRVPPEHPSRERKPGRRAAPIPTGENLPGSRRHALAGIGYRATSGRFTSLKTPSNSAARLPSPAFPPAPRATPSSGGRRGAALREAITLSTNGAILEIVPSSFFRNECAPLEGAPSGGGGVCSF